MHVHDGHIVLIKSFICFRFCYYWTFLCKSWKFILKLTFMIDKLWISFVRIVYKVSKELWYFINILLVCCSFSPNHGSSLMSYSRVAPNILSIITETMINSKFSAGFFSNGSLLIAWRKWVVLKRAFNRGLELFNCSLACLWNTGSMTPAFRASCCTLAPFHCVCNSAAMHSTTRTIARF